MTLCPLSMYSDVEAFLGFWGFQGDFAAGGVWSFPFASGPYIVMTMASLGSNIANFQVFYSDFQNQLHFTSQSYQHEPVFPSEVWVSVLLGPDHPKQRQLYQINSREYIIIYYSFNIVSTLCSFVNLRIMCCRAFLPWSCLPGLFVLFVRWCSFPCLDLGNILLISLNTLSILLIFLLFLLPLLLHGFLGLVSCSHPRVPQNHSTACLFYLWK